jgi:glutathione S-transferase
MHGLILHSYRRCPFAIRVRMTLEEKNLEYTVIEEDLSAPSIELQRLHPEVRVPLLIHQDVPIHESSIITEYLDEVFENPPLRPASALERAQMRLWTYWCDQLFKPDLDLFKYEWEKISAEERASLLERLHGHLRKMEFALAESPFLMGKKLTLADIHVFPFYRQFQKARSDFSKFFQPKGLDQWLEKITKRPSFVRVMKV